MGQSRFEQVNLYAVLGVPVSANASEVRSAYRHAALRTHPDKGGSSEAFHITALAFEVLSCPVTRSLYDKYEQQEVCTTAAAAVPSERHPKVPSWQTRLDEALVYLQSVLQSMEAHLRRLAIPKLPACVRAALLNLIECQPKVPMPSRSPQRRRAVSLGSAGSSRPGSLRTIRGLHCTKYQACIRIKALRIYTHEHFDIEAAVEHQLILARLRHEIAAATVTNPDLWLEPEELTHKCLAVLRGCGLPGDSAGLRVFLEFRASPWCGPHCTISSPTFSSLREALQLNARLLGARSKSWEAMRFEWIQLLMISRRGRPKRLRLPDAAAIADTARRGAVQQQMQQAVRAVEVALALRTRKTLDAQTKARKAAKKHAVRQRELFWKERRRNSQL